jgi:proteic killer suppression protein
MIKSFRCKDTEKLYNRVFVKKFLGLERSALKRLRILDSADTLEALANLPSNRLERLKGDRMGQYSVFGIHLGQNRDDKQGRVGILLSLTVSQSAV